MTRSRKLLSLIAFAAVVAATVLWLQWPGGGSPPVASAPVVQKKSDARLSPVVRAAPPVAPIAGPQPVAEAAATSRMYAAHAPLRTPELANPDSAANKQILQTMVNKALAASATTTPPARN